MNDPAAVLFSPAMEENIFYRYVDDPRQFRTRQKAHSAAYERLRSLLEPQLQKELEAFMEEEASLDSINQESTFTTGLALGLQLLRLL